MAKNYREQYIEGESAAALLGISSRTLRRWKDEGAIARHSDGRYGLISLLQFAIQRKKEEAGKNAPQNELLIAQAKKCEVEADIKELQRDKLANSLVDAEEAAEAWAAQKDRIRESADRLPLILPEQLFELMPPEIRDNLSEAQKDRVLCAWEEKFEKEVTAATTEC